MSGTQDPTQTIEISQNGTLTVVPWPTQGAGGAPTGTVTVQNGAGTIGSVGTIIDVG